MNSSMLLQDAPSFQLGPMSDASRTTTGSHEPFGHRAAVLSPVGYPSLSQSTSAVSITISCYLHF